MPKQPEPPERRPSSFRLPGLRIKPGSARSARLEAGLSLAELAGGRISRTALHLIETGQTRPTLPTLLLIVERTRKPIEFFLEPGEEVLATRPFLDLGALAGIELALEQERFEDALALANQAHSATPSSTVRARALLYAGQAHVRLAHPELATPVLAEAM